MIHDIQSLLLGGGFGYLTGQHGLVIDNLLQVRHSLVTALQYLDNSYGGHYCYREWDCCHS
jgi:hypothetical protein